MGEERRLLKSNPPSESAGRAEGGRWRASEFTIRGLQRMQGLFILKVRTLYVSLAL